MVTTLLRAGEGQGDMLHGSSRSPRHALFAWGHH